MMNAKRSSKFTLTRYAFVVPAVIALLLVFTLSKADVAKPITHKIALAIDPVTSAIKEAAKTAMAITDTVPVKKEKTITLKATKDTAKTKQTLAFTYNTVIDTDTGKKQRFYIRSDNNNSNKIDSMNIVLNGKKIDSKAFSKVDPSTISTINIVGSFEANRILGGNGEYDFNNDKDIMFITTKDSETGKALAEKLGSRRQLTNIRINGVQKELKNLTKSEVELVRTLPALKGTVNNVTVIAHGNASTILADEMREVVLDSALVRVNGIKGSGVAGVESKLRSTVGTGNVIAYQASPLKLRTANGISVRDDVVIKELRTNGNYVYSTNIPSVTRISDKLIVIDGKIASKKEMKKLSAFDIDRINTSTSADTVKKYGDKAKYGVVFIYTKKGK